MAFYITIQHNKKDIRLKVNLVYRNDRVERYEVAARNKRFIIERTRPLFLHAAVKLPSEWRLIEGQKEVYGKLKDEIITEIRKVVE